MTELEELQHAPAGVLVGLERALATLRAIRLAPLVLVTSAALPACHATLSPERIDQIHSWCGAHPFDPSRPSSKSIAFRASAKPAGTPVVIYGAQWCAACEATADYLARRHIPYVEKDIEHDDGADAEMRATLAAVGFEGSEDGARRRRARHDNGRLLSLRGRSGVGGAVTPRRSMAHVPRGAAAAAASAAGLGPAPSRRSARLYAAFRSQKLTRPPSRLATAEYSRPGECRR